MSSADPTAGARRAARQELQDAALLLTGRDLGTRHAQEITDRVVRAYLDGLDPAAFGTAPMQHVNGTPYNQMIEMVLRAIRPGGEA